MRVTPARAPASTDQRCQTSFRGELVLAWPQNGVISPDLNLGCWEHMSSSMQATFRLRFSLRVDIVRLINSHIIIIRFLSHKVNNQ